MVKKSNIIERDKEEKIDEFNVNHNEEGEFSSERDASCYSSYYVDGKRKRKSGKLTDKDETGTGRKRTQGKYKCYSNEPKWEALYREFINEQEEDSANDEHVDVPQDMYDCAKLRQKDKVLMRKLKKAVVDAQKSGKKDCGLSIKDAVRIINTLELAQKGKAFDKPGDEDG